VFLVQPLMTSLPTGQRLSSNKSISPTKEVRGVSKIPKEGGVPIQLRSIPVSESDVNLSRGKPKGREVK
jgi:hypothetical protein